MEKQTKIGLLFCVISGIMVTTANLIASAIGAKKISQNGINLIKSFEGCKLTAYKDSAGVLTIGYGHTGNDVTAGKTITQQEAENLLKSDVSKFEIIVATATITKQLTQKQFDALVSFCYNVGGTNFTTSTLLKKVLANPNDKSIKDEFLRWKYAGGRVVQGLLNRREKESNYYFS